MAGHFSSDGKYFALLSSEGKLKLWNTLTNSFEQEFTPNYQLTAASTCITFLSSKTELSPKKKRRKSMSEGELIALGTSSGCLLVYSITKSDLDYYIDSKTSQSINCLSFGNNLVYSGTDTGVLVWNLAKRSIVDKWSTANEKVASILVIAGSDRLLTASKSIKLWSISSKEVLRTYTGHSSEVSMLSFVSSQYFVSSSKGDRLLNCWSLDEDSDGKNTVAFLLEDVANHLSAEFVNGTLHLAATIRTGAVHVFQHILNGKKALKPVKPKTTIQVAADDGNEAVTPISVTAASFRTVDDLCICYGSSLVLTFENIGIATNQKVQCLLRSDPHKNQTSKQNQVAKVRNAVVPNDVTYLAGGKTTKRKSAGGHQEVPMEKRLENLVVNDSEKVPKWKNVSQLLVQGLHSKDKSILNTVFFTKDEQLVKNTLRRLPMQCFSLLFEELTKLMQGKTLARQTGILWLKNLLLVHSSLLLSNPDLPHFVGDILGCVESELGLSSARNKLIGRLELLVSQLHQSGAKEDEEEEEPVIVFNDKGAVSSDSEQDEMEFDDNTDSEWDETSGGEQNGDAKMEDSDEESEDDAMSS